MPAAPDDDETLSSLSNPEDTMDEDDLSSNMYPSDDDDNFFNGDDEMADGSEEEVEETQGASQYDDDVDVMGDSFAADADEKRKSCEVEYSCKRPQQIVEAQQREIDHVASMFLIKDTDAAILLRYFGWNKEKLIERYMESPDAIIVAAGLSSTALATRLARWRDFECEVCFTSSADEPTGQMETLALPCGHRFCKECYGSYLTQKISNEGESRRVQCLQENCSLVVDENTVALVTPQEVFERYKRLLNRTYVDDSTTLRWCPAPNCDNAIECHVPQKSLKSIVPSVTCDCGHSFCFGCGFASHLPAICGLVRLWVKKCADDSETANWISANTKECPKCVSTIEKNGGCNHMTCRKCRYEWCWICAGPWSEHGNSWYNCNRYDEKSGTDARSDQAKSRASLERYLHYFNRFANHEQSAKLERDLYGRIEKKMEEMQLTSDLTWIEVQFLKKAVDTLSVCRMALKWTYCMAFYLQRDNMTELFEDNQRDLERAVEDLSEQLEKPIERDTIPALRQKVTDLTVYVHKRREILLSDTAQGHKDGRWKWSVTIP